MGNCAGSKTDSSEVEERHRNLDSNSVRREEQHNVKETESKHRFLVSIQSLSSQQKWENVIEGLVSLQVDHTKVEEILIYTLEASAAEGISFREEIKIPGSIVQRITETTIQWTNGDGWTRRLIFTSEADVNVFLQLCPMCKTISGHENISNTALPDLEAKHNNVTELELSVVADVEGQTEIDVELDGKLSASTSFNASIKSEDDDFAADSDMELYSPSSPFRVEDFILPDIQEESEELELEVGCQAPNPPEKLNQTSSTLEETETSFSEEVLSILERTGSLRMKPQEGSTPPLLPTSPPPGPLLTSGHKTPLAPIPMHTTANSVPQKAPVFQSKALYRHSVAGAMDDLPPPLPKSQPPGKLMSPRQSLFMDLADMSGSYHPELDLSQLVPQMKRIREAPLEENIASDQEKHSKDTDDKGSDVIEVNILPPAVPPPFPEEDFDVNKDHMQKSKRPESYYLRTFEPPKEFSDSGFQDTDNTAEHLKSLSPQTAMLEPSDIPASSPRESMHATQAWVQKIDSSTTFTSDEQMTENSGSVVLKAAASPGSESISSGESGEKESGEVVTATPSSGHKQSTVEIQAEKTPVLFISPIRKTGWLEMKAVLVSKNKKVDMRAKRRWKKYWANLKGCMMLFYECVEEDALPELETVHADMKLDLELSLAHAVHDHVKRDNLFCLSTSNGNTYYMQSTSQTEVEDWITSIHCAAAVSLTQTDKEHSVAILTKKMVELKENIEKENKLKNMVSLVSTSHPSEAPDKLALEFSENLEKFQVELYRTRCYIASLQDMELPNPHSLLGSISKPTKTLLGNIGIISVASLHAIVSARSNSSSATISTQTTKSSKQKNKSSTMPRSPSLQHIIKGSVEISGPLPKSSAVALGTSWNLSAKAKSSSLPTNMKGSVSLRSFKISGPHLHLSQTHTELTRTPEGTPRKKRSLNISGPYPKLSTSISGKLPLFPPSDQEDKTDDEMAAISMSSSLWPAELNIVTIRVPTRKADGDDQAVQWTLRNDTTAGQLLSSLCEKYELNSPDYFLRSRTVTKGEIKCHALNAMDIVSDQVFDEFELCPKSLKSIRLTIQENKVFGLTLAPEWSKMTEIDLETVKVQEVAGGGVAENAGIQMGDEVVLVNGTSVTELGWVEVERLMEESTEVELMLRLPLVDAPPSNTSSAIVDSLICPPPPPHQPELSAELLRSLIIPTPSIGGDSSLLDEPSRLSGLSQDQIDHLINHSNEIQRLLRRWRTQQSDNSTGTTWTTEDRLRKSIQDLVETEGEYVRLLNVLVERYLEPLKQETLLKAYEVDSLTGSIIDITGVQNIFFTSLKASLHVEEHEDTSESLKQVLSKVTKLFQDHIGHFRKYTSFCASHQIIKELLAGENETLLEFFRVRNPTTDRSLNVDRLLAKPIVRILRYPLFLKAMLDYVDKGTPESVLLKDIIDQMGHVADFINEMQRLCETYWPLIHQLASNTKLLEIGVSVRITELEYHGEVTWLNPGLTKKWKKGQGPAAHIFIFRSALIIICTLGKQKKKDSRTILDARLEAESTKYREILPTVKCRVSSLPDSDGVTNMWHLQFRKHSDGQATTYLFRSSSVKEKQLAIEAAQESIKEQRKLYGSSPRHTPSSSPVPPSFRVNNSPSFLNTGHSPTQQHHLRANMSPQHRHGTPSASDTDQD